MISLIKNILFSSINTTNYQDSVVDDKKVLCTYIVNFYIIGIIIQYIYIIFTINS